MVLDERDEQACAATSEEVRAVRLAEGLFPARLHENLLSLFDATWSIAYSLRSVDDAIEADALSAVAPVRAQQVREVLDSNLMTQGRQGPFIQLRPAARQRNRALTLGQLVRDRAQLRLFSQQAGLHHIGVDGLDQMRMLVCEGPTLKAFVGVYRAEPFSARHRLLLSRLQPALLERTRVLSLLSQAELSLAALSTVFENSANGWSTLEAG